MSTKLTLSLDETAIRKAKAWARSHHTSLSKMVEGFFESLASDENGFLDLAPGTRKMMGQFKAADEGLSYKELRDKHKGNA